MKKFFVDPSNLGWVRGGFYDDMGGMLVGMHANEVCNILNTHYEKEENKDAHDDLPAFLKPQAE